MRLGESVRRELGCRRLTRTRLTDAVASPHLVGWWTPTIVMSLSFVDLDDESLRAILLAQAGRLVPVHTIGRPRDVHAASHASCRST